MARLSSFGPSSPGSPPSPVRLTEKFEGGTKTSDVGGSLLCGSNPEKYKTRPLASYFTDTLSLVVGCHAR